LACTRLGEATVWSSLGRPMVSCSSLSLPVGLAMVEASPASPRSPQRSPASVFPGFFPPAPNPPSPTFGVGPGTASASDGPIGEPLGSEAPAPPATGGDSEGSEVTAPLGPVLPPAQTLQAPQGEVFVSPPLRVYSRQRRRARTPAPAAVDSSSQCPGEGSPSRKLEKVRRQVDMLAPLPMIQKRRKKAQPSGSLPRRSRRVAGAAPFPLGPVLSEAQKRVMRQLGFEEREIIQPNAQDNYSKLFRPFLS